jgi:hypothetical protein
MGFWSYLYPCKYNEWEKVLQSEPNPTVEFNGQTYNTSKLWAKALGDRHLSTFEGWQAVDFIPELKKAIKYLEDKPDEFVHLEAANRWGTISSSIRYLRAVLKACEENPNCYYHYSG